MADATLTWLGHAAFRKAAHCWRMIGYQECRISEFELEGCFRAGSVEQL